MTTRAQCTNGHPWAPDRTTCADCGAGPLVHQAPEQAVRPPAFPHQPAEWVTVGGGLLLVGLVLLVLAANTDESDQAIILWIFAALAAFTAWFSLTVGAVIIGVQLVLRDRDRP